MYATCMFYKFPLMTAIYQKADACILETNLNSMLVFFLYISPVQNFILP